MWVHFESMHILVRPVYASVFPVAQGMVMAVGQVFTRQLPPDPPFRFVKLGTEAIEAPRSPEEIRRKMLQKVTAEYTPPYRFGCDQWAYFFTELTGVEAPDLSQGCFPPGQHGKVVSFEEWFAWLERQR